MIGRLTGAIVEEGEGGVLVVDVNGVGYEVVTPLGTRGRLSLAERPPALGAASPPVTLYVHTHVREDAISLFGFATLDERDTFRVLIGISNVGPKLGIAVLGSVTVNDLAIAVGRGETAKLTAIPGVGKKTAERLVLELKGKLTASAAPTPTKRGDGPPAPHAKQTNADLLTGALTRMGYRPQEAERAIAALSTSKEIESTALGDLVREALAFLSK